MYAVVPDGPLFRTTASGSAGVALHHYIPSADGQRFFADTTVEAEAPPITLVLNWRPRPD